MPILTDSSVLTYNGYVFPGGCATEIEVDPVMDAADRTVIYCVMRVSVTWYIASTTASAHESLLTEVRNRLSKAGADYAYSGHGMGPVASTINLKDVKWGPKPGKLNITPMGPIACELSWSFEVAYPTCTNALGARFPLAYNYTTTFNIDTAGYSTRRITGYLEMPLSRIGSQRSIAYTADEFYEQVVPAEIPGFHRTTRERTISADKRRLDFTFVDEEQKDSLPKNIAEAEGEFRIQSFPRQLSKYTASLSVNYTLAKNTPRQFAIDAFVQLMLLRIKAAKEGGKDAKAIIVQFGVTEGLYKSADRISLNAQWLFFSTITKCIKSSGMFVPIPNTSWLAWEKSPFVHKANSPRGVAGLRLNARDDAIVDLCSRPTVPEVTSTAFSPRPQNLPTPITTLTKVTPESSWIVYECDLQVTEIRNQVILKSVGPESIASSAGTVVGGVLSGALSSGILPPNKGGKLITEPSSTDTGEIQERATPTYRAILSGKALRAKFEIVPPKLVKLGGAEVVEARKDFVQRKAADWGEDIYWAMWRIEYLCESPPSRSQIETPGNPAFAAKK